MAEFTLVFDDDLESILDNIERQLPEIEEKMLKSEAELFLPVAKSNLQGVIQNRAEINGELVSSLGISDVKPTNTGGRDISVGFHEPRRIQRGPSAYHVSKRGKLVANRGYYVLTNALIGNVIEHGKYNQPARPWMAPARIQMEEPCIREAQRVYDEEIERLQK